jgi:hypothetical protein
VICGRPVIAFRPNWRSVMAPPKDHDLCRRHWKAEQDRRRDKPEKTSMNEGNGG